MKKTKGIHHITAIVGHPAENLHFYETVLGLRLVKKTVNFDDPGTYHLYFGNGTADPGTLITFFPWPNARQGKVGGGQVGTTVYAVPQGTLSYWAKRLQNFGIETRQGERLGEKYLSFQDVHGLQLELTERKRSGAVDENSHEIFGFAGAVLLSVAPQKTMNALSDTMGFVKVGEDEVYARYQSEAELGNIVDVDKRAYPRGDFSVGTVHHIAFRAENDEDHLSWQNHVQKRGHYVTEVKDRNYFNAIYFREGGGILFEIATDTPGFAVDEPMESLGETLKLPRQYESRRSEIERSLIPLKKVKS